MRHIRTNKKCATYALHISGWRH